MPLFMSHGSWVTGHAGHGSPDWWVTWITNHGSQNVTHCQLWIRMVSLTLAIILLEYVNGNCDHFYLANVTACIVLNPVVGCHHLPQAHSDTHAYHNPGGRLALLSARPAVTFPAVGHHRPQASTKLYCLVTEVHRCEKLAQSFYAVVPGRDSNPRPLGRESDTYRNTMARRHRVMSS